MAPPRSALLTICVLLASCLVRAALVQRELTVTWEVGAPNGNARPMVLINGQFPGPVLQFDEDDDVEITVCNHMPFNTTMHWHGMLQQGTPWSDGVPGLHQRPINPGESYVYRFKAYPSGTHWYHSHSRMDLVDGMYGALYVRPKPTAPTPFSLFVNHTKLLDAMTKASRHPKFVLISDWSNYTSEEYMHAQIASGLNLFCVDSILVNGKGSVYCPGEQFLINNTTPGMIEALAPGFVNDKGCFPHVANVQGPFLANARPDLVPPHLWSGCVPSEGFHEVIEVDPAEGYASLNFIMASTFKAVTVSIDDHDMWVYEADGHFIYPKKVQALRLMPGTRYAVLLQLNRKPGDYTIRLPDSGDSQIIDANATLRYKVGGRKELSPTKPTYVNGNSTQPKRYLDYGGQNTTANVTFFDEFNMPPFPPNPPALHGDVMHVLNLSRWTTSAHSWTMSGSASMVVDSSWQTPLLYHPTAPLTTNSNLTFYNPSGAWVDLVLQVGHTDLAPVEIYHPVHKHASKMWQVGVGMGPWNYSSVADAAAVHPEYFNFKTPPLRDTFITTLAGRSWIVLRYQATNPGPWLFHCHVETHLSGGMAVVLMDGVEDWPQIPPEYRLN